MHWQTIAETFIFSSFLHIVYFFSFFSFLRWNVSMVELRITREKKHFATNGKEALTFSQTTAALFRSIKLPSKNHSVDREPFRERNTPTLSRFVTRSIDVLYSSYYILWLVVDFLVRDSTDFVTPVSCHVPRNERANNINTFDRLSKATLSCQIFHLS